jgi:hypothetical protein
MKHLNGQADVLISTGACTPPPPPPRPRPHHPHPPSPTPPTPRPPSSRVRALAKMSLPTGSPCWQCGQESHHRQKSGLSSTTPLTGNARGGGVLEGGFHVSGPLQQSIADDQDVTNPPSIPEAFHTRLLDGRRGNGAPCPD